MKLELRMNAAQTEQFLKAHAASPEAQERIKIVEVRKAGTDTEGWVPLEEFVQHEQKKSEVRKQRTLVSTPSGPWREGVEQEDAPRPASDKTDGSPKAMPPEEFLAKDFLDRLKRKAGRSVRPGDVVEGRYWHFLDIYKSGTYPLQLHIGGDLVYAYCPIDESVDVPANIDRYEDNPLGVFQVEGVDFENSAIVVSEKKGAGKEVTLR